MTDDVPDDPQGGSGGDARESPFDGGYRDRRLMRRAMAEGWAMPARLRNQILQQLVDILDPDHDHDGKINPSHRERTSAAKVLAALAMQNIELAKLEVLEERVDLDRRRVEIEERRLGLLAGKREADCPNVRDVLGEAERAAQDYAPPPMPEPSSNP